MVDKLAPRLVPVPREEWTAEVYDALQVMSSLAPPRPAAPPAQPADPARGSNVLGMFANYPELAKAYFAFNGHILYRSTIAGRHREMVILRVAALRRAHYEWAQHVQIGRDEGLTDEEIEAIIDGPPAGDFDPFETALLNSVDELVSSAHIGDATWAVLSEQFTKEQLMDLVFTIGAYDLLAMAFTTFQLQMEESLARVTPRLDGSPGVAT